MKKSTVKIEKINAGISKKDFTSKMSVVSKKARESLYWIRFLEHSKLAQYNFNHYKKNMKN